MAEWGTLRKIEPSAFDPGTAYVVVDYHLMDDGAHWIQLQDALPTAPVTFEIRDAAGEVIRTFSVDGRSGLDTVAWDLLYGGHSPCGGTRPSPPRQTTWRHRPGFRSASGTG
jgi:hypothetical protein